MRPEGCEPVGGIYGGGANMEGANMKNADMENVNRAPEFSATQKEEACWSDCG